MVFLSAIYSLCLPTALCTGTVTRAEEGQGPVVRGWGGRGHYGGTSHLLLLGKLMSWAFVSH